MQVTREGIFVRLLIYSGRPDPEWSLDADALEPFVARMRTTLGGERIHPVSSARLGYRGFLVRNPTRSQDLPAEFTVFRKVITVQPGPRAVHWRDTSGIEEFLLAEARRRGYEALLAAAGVGERGLD